MQTKTKIMAFSIIIMLLFITLAPGINAISIENDTKKDDPILFGIIHGMVTNTGFPPLLHISGAKLELKGGLSKRITFSGYLGMYSFLFVPFGPYDLTVSHPNYESETVSFNFYEPLKVISFELYEKENSKKIVRNTDKKIVNELIVETDDTGKFGRVYGDVTVHSFPPPTYIVGAKLVLEEDFTKRTTYSGILGVYRFNFVLVGRQYTLTVSHTEYKTESKTFTLLPSEPNKVISFSLYEKENSKTNDENVNGAKTQIVKNNCITNEQICFGTIIGKTGAYSWSGWGPINNVKVTIGSRKKYSRPHFFFTDLPLDQTYTITASKAGWKTQTKEITLTEDNPIANIQFDLDNNGDNDAKIEELERMTYLHGCIGNSLRSLYEPGGIRTCRLAI